MMRPNLGQIADVLSSLTDLTPALDTACCLNVRHQQAGQCTACQAVCPVDAVTLDPTPAFDANTCLGCDACTAACPVSALTGKFEVLAAVRRALAQAADEGAVRLGCRALGKGRFDAVRVPCLGALPAEFYLLMAAAGGREVTAYTADCTACPLAGSLTAARDALDDVYRVLDGLGLYLDVQHQVAPPPLLAEEAPSGVSRRQFLRGLIQTPEAAPRSDDRLDAFMTAGVGWRHALLLEALRRLDGAQPVVIPLWEGHAADVAATDQCIGCEMCAQFCPTGSLRVTHGDDGALTLWFDAARCTGCGLCVRACFKHAITLRETVDLTALPGSEYVPLWQGVPPTNALNKHRRR
jgi:formate hydrogenlyase subunit 6/NADH:ubiquinone oxidoreductase subunit I